jgi:hypothetical protein
VSTHQSVIASQVVLTDKEEKKKESESKKGVISESNHEPERAHKALADLRELTEHTDWRAFANHSSPIEERSPSIC